MNAWRPALLVAVAFATTAPPRSALAEREVKPAISIDARARKDQPKRVVVEASVEIEAPPEAVWAAIVDFDARVDESWIVKDCEVYARKNSSGRYMRKVRWDLSVLGIAVTYHTVYRSDPSRRQISWGLDERKENDLRFARGTYALHPVRGGTTRLDYEFEIESRVEAAVELRKSLTSREVKKLLTNVEKRAKKVRM